MLFRWNILLIKQNRKATVSPAFTQNEDLQYATHTIFFQINKQFWYHVEVILCLPFIIFTFARISTWIPIFSTFISFPWHLWPLLIPDFSKLWEPCRIINENNIQTMSIQWCNTGFAMALNKSRKHKAGITDGWLTDESFDSRNYTLKRF